MKNIVTLEEALAGLNIIEDSKMFHDALVKGNINLPKSNEVDYDNNYNDLLSANHADMVAKYIREHNIPIGTLFEGNDYDTPITNLTGRPNRFDRPEIPSIGDIAILRIKLSDKNAADKDKRIYEGCERRPCLIVSVDNDKVDAFELTHSKSFNGMQLVNLGHLSDDTRTSYLNISDEALHAMQEYEYLFPMQFDENNKPMTLSEIVGKIVPGTNENEPLLVQFSYQDNYCTTVDNETMEKIFAKIKQYTNYERKEN